MSEFTSVSEHTDIVIRHFDRSQWGIAFEGLVQGVAVWNSTYADSGGSPASFLLTVCRRRVIDAMIAGELLDECRSFSVLMSRSKKSQRTRNGSVTRRITFMDSCPRSDGNSPHLPTVARNDHQTRAVAEYAADQGSRFIDLRDEIDQTIIRLRAQDVPVPAVCKIAGITVDAYRRRILVLRDAYRLRESVDSRPSFAATLALQVAQRKRAAARKQPPPACAADDQTGVAEPL